MYRDFIYLDTDRLQSIIAPLQEGLLDQVIEGKIEEYSGGGEDYRKPLVPTHSSQRFCYCRLQERG